VFAAPEIVMDPFIGVEVGFLFFIIGGVLDALSGKGGPYPRQPGFPPRQQKPKTFADTMLMPRKSPNQMSDRGAEIVWVLVIYAVPIAVTALTIIALRLLP
jgi:hypothetical protein